MSPRRRAIFVRSVSTFDRMESTLPAAPRLFTEIVSIISSLTESILPVVTTDVRVCDVRRRLPISRSSYAARFIARVTLRENSSARSAYIRHKLHACTKASVSRAPIAQNEIFLKRFLSTAEGFILQKYE